MADIVPSQGNQLANNSTDIFRIDKNIAKQGVDFERCYGIKTGSLIFDVAVYIASTFQDNLYQYGVLDVKDFAKKLGYSVANLKRKAKDITQPESERIEGRPETHFVSEIENALYTAGVKNLTFSQTVTDYTNNVDSHQISFYQLIQDVTKHSCKTRKDQYTYTFTVSETFTKHLSIFFTLPDFEMLKILRPSKNRNLYLFILTVKEAARATENPFEAEVLFDVICQKAALNYKQNKRKKIELVKKLKIIQEHYEFDWVWFNKYGNYDYGLKLLFKNNAPHKSEELKEKEKFIIRKAMQDLIDNAMVSFYRSKFQQKGRLNKAKFEFWLRDIDQDKTFKIDTYFKIAAEFKKIRIEKAKIWYRKDAEIYFNCVNL